MEETYVGKPSLSPSFILFALLCPSQIISWQYDNYDSLPSISYITHNSATRWPYQRDLVVCSSTAHTQTSLLVYMYICQCLANEVWGILALSMLPSVLYPSYPCSLIHGGVPMLRSTSYGPIIDLWYRCLRIRKSRYIQVWIYLR